MYHSYKNHQYNYIADKRTNDRDIKKIMTDSFIKDMIDSKKLEEDIKNAIDTNDENTINRLIDKIYTIHYTIDDKPILIYSILKNNICAVKKLIDKKFDINISLKGDKKLTALMISIFNNNNEIANLLIDSGADINIEITFIINSKEEIISALFGAIMKNNIELIKKLVSKNVIINDNYSITYINNFRKMLIEANNNDIKLLIQVYNLCLRKDMSYTIPLEKAIEKNIHTHYLGTIKFMKFEEKHDDKKYIKESNKESNNYMLNLKKITNEFNNEFTLGDELDEIYIKIIIIDYIYSLKIKDKN